MQFTNLFTVLALAMTATALPAADNSNVVARTGGGGGGGGGEDPAPGTCSINNQPVCCDGLLGILLCTVGILSNNCEGSSYCCNTEAPVGALINISLLNCLNILN